MMRPAILEQRDKNQQTPVLDRVAAMKEQLQAAGDEAQELRHLPAWASQEMAGQGLYRMPVPAELGGEDASAREQIETIEAVSAIDGSRMESPLERQLRDAQQSATHTLITWRHYEDIGKTFVGHDPAINYVELGRA